MPLGRITFADATLLPLEYRRNLFDLTAVGLNRSYLGADSLRVIIKLSR